jgi:Mn2+/Fe2+ NRAMP family transporter
MSDAPEPDQAANQTPRVEQDRQMINQARQRGTGPLFWAFTKLSGPGWLQSAITLGGGSLGGSLYLGVLAGFGMLWWQPMAMILGVVMLSAISYVTLSTGRRPFESINQHVNPVLGWGWLIGSMMANMVWAMPQFSLGSAALQQNLLPGLIGESAMDPTQGKFIAVAMLFATGMAVIWLYDSGGRGVRIFEAILKIMVGVVVVSFFGVVAKMITSGGLTFSTILDGFIPRFGRLTNPSPEFEAVIAQAGAFGEFWRSQLLSTQQGAMISAVATAVGINMTFLMPYSILARGWDRDFRELASFDLATGLFIPYLLATTCVVVAAAAQFHGPQSPDNQALAQMYENPSAAAGMSGKLISGYHGLLDARLKADQGESYESLSDEQKQAARAALPEADRLLAAMLVKRDARDLAASLERLVGRGTAQIVFGIGVLGMAVSTIIILMLINGFVVSEMLGLPNEGWPRRLGAALAGLSGAAGSFIFGTPEAEFWLVVPTSMFGMTLLPVAYWTFILLFNSRSLMGANMPTGGKRLAWNIAMVTSASVATILCLWSISLSTRPVSVGGTTVRTSTIGFGILIAFVTLAAVVQLARRNRTE